MGQGWFYALTSFGMWVFPIMLLGLLIVAIAQQRNPGTAGRSPSPRKSPSRLMTGGQPIPASGSKLESEMAKTILVVDDEERILHLLKDYLEQENFRVVTAADGREALFVGAP